LSASSRPPNERLSIRERAILTYRYLGWRELARRVLTLPLRPMRRRPGTSIEIEAARRHALRWYEQHGRAVTVVIPTYGAPALVAAAVRSIRRTTDRALVRVVVTDDASAAGHVRALKRVKGIDTLILGEHNAGFAANTNRGLAVADPSHDVVLLNSDVVARNPAWLACLQHAADTQDRVGVVGPKLLYRDARIQHAGVYRNLNAPEWFDHRYRYKAPDHGPANVPAEVLAVTGACMYLTREAREAIGLLDERYGMSYEDIDWCVRCWQAGYRVLYEPAAVLEHPESATRPTQVGVREQVSQDAFWERWGSLLDPERRMVHAPGGGLRIIYVTQDTGLGGGHRDVFEHLNRLVYRGHDAQLFTLDGPPDWFDLRAPVRTFADYEKLTDALADEDAIKVATWWRTAAPVWRASLLRGIPVYLVQDIETSYYPDHELDRDRVLASYREEFTYLTISSWNAARLQELGLRSTLIPPGIDLQTFRPLPGRTPREDVVLALGRSNPLKNFALTASAWQALAERPQLWLFGIEPDLGSAHGARYVLRPTDAAVNELFNDATVFVQTSSHEGFCLPVLEAMAAGCAVVCTDAHGNLDFCVDGENCLMPEPTVKAVAQAISRALADSALREQLVTAGTRTAQQYAWHRRIDALEQFYAGLADADRVGNGSELLGDARSLSAEHPESLDE